MSAHTPGPWWISEEGDVQTGNTIGTDVMAGAKDSDSLHCVAADVTNRADADLIAIAPELRDACETLLMLVRLKFGNLDGGVNLIIAEATALLAKARGES